MPQVRYITSESQIGAPGTYVLEQAPASPVKGQKVRTVGLAGQCSRGPVGKYVYCNSYKRFLDVFGSRDHNSNGGTVYGHIWRALQGKYWGGMYIARVAAAAAVKASFTLESAAGGAGVALLTVTAYGPGIEGNDIQIKVTDATNGDANYFNLVTKLYGVVKLYQNVTIQTGLDNTNQVIGTDDATLIRVTKVADGRPYSSIASIDGADSNGYTKLGTAVVYKQLDLSTKTTHANTVIRSRLPNTTPHVVFLHASVGAAGVLTEVGNVVTINYLTATTTVTQLEALIGTSTLIEVLTPGTGANILTQPADDFTDTALGAGASFTSVVGADGGIADSDYIAAGGPMELLNNTRGIHAAAVVGRSNTAIKAKVAALNLLTAQRVWFICPDDSTIQVAAAVTERAALFGGRMSYWFNHEYIIDSITLETIQVEPFLLPMSIISQTNPDVHVGDFDNAVYTGGSQGVTFELSDADRDSLNGTDSVPGGVSFIHRDLDAVGNDVVIPGNALTCDFAENNEDLDGRYMKDFLLDALAQRLRGDQFKGNTKKNRAARAAACSGFLTTLAKNDQYIMRDETSGKPQFTYKNDETVNTTQDQAGGLQREVLIAQLIPKNKQILLSATIGVDATISEQ